MKSKGKVKGKNIRKINNNLNAKDDFIMQIYWGLACQNYLWCNVNNFSLSNVIPVYTHIYYDTLSLVSRMKSLIYLFFSLKSFCKDKIVNHIKIKDDAWNRLNKHHSIPSNNFIYRLKVA